MPLEVIFSQNQTSLVLVCRFVEIRKQIHFVLRYLVALRQRLDQKSRLFELGVVG